MVVLTTEAVRASTSYNVALEPAPPFWMLEYVSKNSERKDYEDSFKKYERELKVPYYLMFYPDNQEMTLYRHNGRRYVSVKPDEHGRCALPELELEMGILEGWVRIGFAANCCRCRPTCNATSIRPSAAPTTKNAAPTTKNAVPTTKNAVPTTKNAVPTTCRQSWGPRSASWPNCAAEPAPRNLPRPKRRPLFPRRHAMSPDLPRVLQELAYEREAAAYLKRLPPEHFMEATPQATQRQDHPRKLRPAARPPP